MKSQISKPNTNTVADQPEATSRMFDVGLREMLKAIAVIGLLAVALSFASPMAHAMHVTNGGFESVTSSAPGSFQTVLPTNWQCTNSWACAPGAEVFAPGTADTS